MQTSPTARQALDYAPIALPRRYPRLLHIEGSVAYAANATSNPLRIDQSGLLLGLLLTFTGTLTTTAVRPIQNNTSPYGLINKVILATGGGVGRSIDVSGYELNQIERTREPDYLDDPVVETLASVGTNAIKFALFVPVAVRDGDTYGGFSDYLGAIYTGDPEITCNFQVVWGAESVIFSNQGAAAAVVAGSLTVTSIKLDCPAPNLDPMLASAISWTHMLVRDFSITTINAAGPVSGILLPTAEPRVYLRHWLFAQNNGVWANGIVSSWDLNLQDYLHFWDNITEQVLLEQQARRYPSTGGQLMPFFVNVGALAATAANTTAEQTVAVAGILASDVIVGVSKPTAQAGLAIGGFRVPSAGNIAITFVNDTAGAITATANEVYTVAVYRVNAPANGLAPGSYVADFAIADVRTQWLPVDRVTLFKSVPTISSVALVAPVLNVVNESMVPSPLARKWLRRMQGATVAGIAA